MTRPNLLLAPTLLAAASEGCQPPPDAHDVVLLDSIMTYSANAARLEFAPGFLVQTQSSSTVSNGADQWVASDFHFGPCMVISGQDTGFDELLRRG